jgi:glycosyltransferase involved in cell wall biosynthesis
MRPGEKIKIRVLIVSRQAPKPGHGSGNHMEDFIRGLTAQACEVHYLALCPAEQADFSPSAITAAYFLEAGEGAGRDFDADAQDWESRAVDRVCRQITPSVVIADYSWMGGIYDGAYFQENPQVRKTTFVHDLRVRIMPCFVKMGLLKIEDNTWTDEREGKLLAKADALLTLNEEDRRMAASLAPQARVLRMGMSVAPRPTDPAAAVPGRCLYVASEANENLFALMWLLKYAWPRVVAAHPSASLVICGSVGDRLQTLPKLDRDWLGSVDDLNVWIEGRKDDLEPYYASAQIALVPHWMMGGIKIKHVEAIAHGLAVVSTPAGVDGLPETVNRSALVAEMPEEFADHVIRLIGDKQALEAMRRNSRALALRLNPESVYREVADYLREL